MDILLVVDVKSVRFIFMLFKLLKIILKTLKKLVFNNNVAISGIIFSISF
jgi:hypothetical protein